LATFTELAQRALSHEKGEPDFINISVESLKTPVKKLTSLPANGENLRGAIIMDLNGNRLEPDIVRGIRASHIGITEEASKALQTAISDMRLSAFYTYISDALVLATKVASVKGTLGELCWSDDPSYTAGYVASGKMGYIRIPHLKKKGNPYGGRVFFVENIDPVNYINEMESAPVLVNRFGGIRSFKE